MYFQFNELALAIIRKDGTTSGQSRTLNLANARHKVVKSGRLQKWKKMVTYGLDEDFANQVIRQSGKTSIEPIQFSKFAKIGLTNFFEAYPNVFLDRLSKGPPPQYRWLAWTVAISKKIKQDKGLYEEQLTRSENSKWLHDINKDLDRTYPLHPYFNQE